MLFIELTKEKQNGLSLLDKLLLSVVIVISFFGFVNLFWLSISNFKALDFLTGAMGIIIAFVLLFGTFVSTCGLIVS